MKKFLRPICILFIALHLSTVLGCLFVPVTWTAAGLMTGLYVVRMFGITAGYHRYFAHRTYRTSRVCQFLLAVLGCSSLQRGPVWWASTHRLHHKHSDEEGDPHSPVVKSVWWAHVGWVLAPDEKNDLSNVSDLTKYPELRLLEHIHWLPGVLLAVCCYLLDGLSGLVWGFCIGTVLLYHCTFLVNSVCHIFGSRRFETGDRSRNNLLVALLTLGEGWHNNHHHCQHVTRQGLRWWEVDMSYYILRMLQLCRVVWKIREPPIRM